MFKDYSNQRINSEHSLQASFWSHLNRILPDTMRMFIEPRIAIGKKVLRPDVVICGPRKVICIIELKYQPRGKPAYFKDIDSLACISEHGRTIKISHERFRGASGAARTYGLSKYVLFVWAGVHAQSNDTVGKVRLFSEGRDCLKGCYLQLHAETRAGRKPRVFQRP